MNKQGKRHWVKDTKENVIQLVFIIFSMQIVSDHVSVSGFVQKHDKTTLYQ